MSKILHILPLCLFLVGCSDADFPVCKIHTGDTVYILPDNKVGLVTVYWPWRGASECTFSVRIPWEQGYREIICRESVLKLKGR